MYSSVDLKRDMKDFFSKGLVSKKQDFEINLIFNRKPVRVVKNRRNVLCGRGSRNNL